MESGKPLEMQSYYNGSETSLVKSHDISSREVPFGADDHLDLEPPTWKDNVKSSMDRFWLLEAMSLFISCGALVLIASLLKAYDHQPLPQWSTAGTFSVKSHINRPYSFSVTLNSVLSLIATVFKISLGIPVAASLGQLKWDWFAEGHKLADFQMFDSAKGVLGSVLLLWNMRARRLACLAAVVTLGSLALDFAFQSLVAYPITRVPSSFKASLPVASLYNNYVDEILSAFDPGGSGVDQSMLGDTYTGIFNFNGSSLVSPVCPTGDCAWNSSATAPNFVTSYASLGVCERCQDSTANVQKSCGFQSAPTQVYSQDPPYDLVSINSRYCNYSLPNDLSLAGNIQFTNYPLMNTSAEQANNTQFQHLATPFSILSIIRGGWTNRYENGTLIDDPLSDELAASYLNNATSSECALITVFVSTMPL